MNDRSRSRRIVAILVGFALSAGLSGGCRPQAGTTHGRLVVRAQPAPGPAEATPGIVSARVDVERVEVFVDAEVDEESAFYVVTSEPLTLELLELGSGLDEILGSAGLPRGRIDQIRVVVPSGAVTLADGRTFDLDIPSGDASGVKVFPDPPILTGVEWTTEVTLDFDVAESFRPTPASARRAQDIRSFRFQPVVRAS